MNKRGKKSLVIILILITILIVSCSSEDKKKKKLVIADQFGLGYAPVQVLKAKGYLEESLPAYEIEWVKMGNASAIREAMISGDLDIGFMGIPPFLIGADHETPWKIFTGLSEAPLGLVSKNQKYTSLKDIQASDQIILPQPGSIQHILLQMASKNEFNQGNKFDDQLLTMNHSDGMNALIAENDLNLHFTSPPYIFKELELEKTHLLIDGKEAFGGSFTFIVGVSQESFFDDEEAYNGFMKSLDMSMKYINENEAGTLSILDEIYDYSKTDLRGYLYNPEMKFSKGINGIDKFAEFMSLENMLDHPLKREELVWKAGEASE